jgi:hypothetical protein
MRRANDYCNGFEDTEGIFEDGGDLDEFFNLNKDWCIFDNETDEFILSEAGRALNDIEKRETIRILGVRNGDTRYVQTSYRG